VTGVAAFAHDAPTARRSRRGSPRARTTATWADAILGAIDETVTTFAIVLGLANVLADGFSMAVRNYLRAKADRQVVEHARWVEESHIESVPDGEREESLEFGRVLFARGETEQARAQLEEAAQGPDPGVRSGCTCAAAQRWLRGLVRKTCASRSASGTFGAFSPETLPST
jgi:hypothetical protein